jgi:competence protein ComEA
MSCRQLALALSATIGLLGSTASLATEKTAIAAPQPAASQAKATGLKPPPPTKLVDINSASKAELKALPGIGDAEADRIIAARPYPSKTKLVVDKVLSEAAYSALSGRIVAEQPIPPKAKAGSKTTAKP